MSRRTRREWERLVEDQLAASRRVEDGLTERIAQLRGQIDDLHTLYGPLAQRVYNVEKATGQLPSELTS